MPTPHTAFLWLLLAVALCASPLEAEQVLFHADLTTGPPRDPRLTTKGGTWNRGWEVTGDLDRLLLDLGTNVNSGYVEVVVTRTGTLSYPERKRNWMGVFAGPKGHQSPGGYARAGAELYGFSKAETFSAGQPNTICEKKFGEASDWVLDGKTEHLVRARISDNVMTWSTGKGATTSCGGDAQPVTHFRYVMLGGVLDHKEGWHHGSLVGLTVLRIRVVSDATSPAGASHARLGVRGPAGASALSTPPLASPALAAPVPPPAAPPG